MRKRRDAEKDLGLKVPENIPAVIVTFRLKGVEARKLNTLAKRLKIGRSAMTRLIVEKFIKQHDPEKE